MDGYLQLVLPTKEVSNRLKLMLFLRKTSLHIIWALLVFFPTFIVLNFVRLYIFLSCLVLCFKQIIRSNILRIKFEKIMRYKYIRYLGITST